MTDSTSNVITLDDRAAVIATTALYVRAIPTIVAIL
jgi:hypothetical protein